MRLETYSMPGSAGHDRQFTGAFNVQPVSDVISSTTMLRYHILATRCKSDSIFDFRSFILSPVAL